MINRNVYVDVNNVYTYLKARIHSSSHAIASAGTCSVYERAEGQEGVAMRAYWQRTKDRPRAALERTTDFPLLIRKIGFDGANNVVAILMIGARQPQIRNATRTHMQHITSAQ
jgi:hypothetical protein